MRIQQKEDSRFRWINLHSSQLSIQEDTDIIQGLSNQPKTLPCRYLYDDQGSELFEQICELPEYYPTRTERASNFRNICPRNRPNDRFMYLDRTR